MADEASFYARNCSMKHIADKLINVSFRFVASSEHAMPSTKASRNSEHQDTYIHDIQCIDA